MKKLFAIQLIACCACFTGATTTFAHVVLQDGVALAGTSYRAALRVGHGCDGAPTTGLRVTIPAGFTGAQPMPKAGWTIATTVGKLAEPYTSHGKTYTEGVQEITWTANSPADALPSDYYDEFIFRGTTPASAGPVWFKVVQSCTMGSNAWVEVPVEGTLTKGLKGPAALLEVLPSQANTHHAH